MISFLKASNWLILHNICEYSQQISHNIIAGVTRLPSLVSVTTIEKSMLMAEIAKLFLNNRKIVHYSTQCLSCQIEFQQKLSSNPIPLLSPSHDYNYNPFYSVNKVIVAKYCLCWNWTWILSPIRSRILIIIFFKFLPTYSISCLIELNTNNFLTFFSRNVILLYMILVRFKVTGCVIATHKHRQTKVAIVEIEEKCCNVCQ